MLHLLQNDKVWGICYVPMFTESIPLISKEHHQFIVATADKFRSLGATIDIVSGLTYYDYVLKRSSRGKFKGRMFGFPPFITGQCGFKRDSKVKSLNCPPFSYDYEDIGIAFDEPKRLHNLSDKKRSILCERKMTEEDARIFDIKHGILSPHYKFNSRDGCALCPHAKAEERKRWFNDYPEAYDMVKQLQHIVKENRPDQTPLRYYRWFIEEDGTIN